MSKEESPLIRIRNPKTGVAIWPKMEKDSAGKLNVFTSRDGGR